MQITPNHQIAFNPLKLLLVGLIPITVGLSMVVFNSAIVSIILLGVLGALYFASQPKACILFFVIWLPFQDFILRWAPPSLFLPIRWSSEALIFLCFFWLCINKFIKGESFKRTVIDVSLLCFLLAVLLSAIWNGSGFFDSMMWLVPLLRYVLLFYIIVNLDIDKKYIKKVIYVISAILLIQISIGLVQFFGGETINQLLAPQRTYSWQVGGIERDIYQTYTLAHIKGKFLFSTFDSGNLYGGFLVVNVLVLIGLSRAIPIKSFVRLMILGFGFFVIVFTYSRGSWLAFYFGLLAIAIVARKKRMLLPLVAIFILVSVVVGVYKFAGSPYVSREETTLIGRFFSTFSEPFFGATRELTRGYILFDGSREIAKKTPLFGIGPGANREDFHTKLGFPYLAAHLIGDVGWVDLFGHVGLFGSLAFFWILARLSLFALRSYGSSYDEFIRGMSLAYIGLLVAMIVFSFPLAHFSIRTTSYYFWLWSGLVLNVRGRDIRKMRYEHRLMELHN